MYTDMKHLNTYGKPIEHLRKYHKTYNTHTRIYMYIYT